MTMTIMCLTAEKLQNNEYCLYIPVSTEFLNSYLLNSYVKMTYQSGTEMCSSECPANNQTQRATHTEPMCTVTIIHA